MGIKEGKRISIAKKIQLDRLKGKIDPAIINAILEDIENGNTKARQSCGDMIDGYISAIAEKNEDKLPFDVTYDCSGKMSAAEYNEVSSYINAVEKAGGEVVGKRRFFGLFKERIDMNNALESPDGDDEASHEKDTSFVQKVETNEESKKRADDSRGPAKENSVKSK